MTLVEAKKIFKALGWQTPRSASSAFDAKFHLPDRFVYVFLKVLRFPGEVLSMQLFLSTNEFIETCRAIEGDKQCYLSLVRSGPGAIRVEAPELLGKHIGLASEAAISWAARQDIEKALEKFVAAGPERIPNFPFISLTCHLAALALQRKAGQLRFYRKKFEEGNRVDFPLYVTKDFFDRALVLAQRKE